MTDGQFRDGYFTCSDGLKLHYRDYPGPAGQVPLLCLPGLTRNVRDFADFAARLSPRFRVIVLEFRGRGESQHDEDPLRYNPLSYARDTLELLDHLALAEAIFVGTSLGGLVTMTLAAMANQRIAATILNDVGPDLLPVGLDRIKDYLGKDARFANWAEAAAVAAHNHRNVPATHGPEDWERVARRLCREDDDGHIRYDYDMAITVPFNRSGPTPQVDMWQLFDALALHPVLVVRGGNSDLLSAECLERMARSSANVRTVTVPGVGHAPELDEPEAVAAIDEFLVRILP